MSSFIRDERAVAEPYTDIVSMAFVMIGFVIFFSIVLQAYDKYTEIAYEMERQEDKVRLPEILKVDPMLMEEEGGAYYIDAAKVEKIAKNPDRLYKRYGSDYNFNFTVSTERWSRSIGGNVEGSPVPHTVPVTVKLNDAEYVSGELIVYTWRKMGW